MIALGAPVFNRAWILPYWWHHIDAQTLRPDVYCFVAGKSDDATDAYLGAAIDPERPYGEPQTIVRQSRLRSYTRDDRMTDPSDRARAQHMAELRNELRALFLSTDADIFISLDTDILLPPDAIERMVAVLSGPDAPDVAAICTCLHPLGFASHCYNAAFFVGGEQGDYHRVWRRADEVTVASQKSPVRIDIPMAAYAIRRHALAMSRYQAHEAGEDIGFADSLQRHGFRTVWLTDVRAPHIWGPDYLPGGRLDFAATTDAVAGIDFAPVRIP